MAGQENEYDNYTTQTGGRLFSSAMFGFNKEEVLEYLEELADENLQQQEAAEMRIQELNKRIQSLEANLASAPQEDLSGELESQRAILEEALRRQAELQSQLEIATAASQQAEDELVQFKEDLNNARQEINWLRGENQTGDEKIAELQRQLETLANQADAQGVDNGELEALRAQLQAAQEETEALRAELNLAHRQGGDVEALQTQLEKANLEIDELRSLVQGNDNDAALQALLDEAQDELVSLRQQLKDSQTSHELDEQAQHEIHELRTEVEELAGLQNELEVTREELEQLRAQLAESQESGEEVEGLHTHIAELVEENKLLRAQLEGRVEAAGEVLQHQLEEQRELNQRLRAQLEELTVDDELQQQIDKLVEENDDLRDQVQQDTERLTELVRQNDTLQQQLQQAPKVDPAAEARVGELQEQLTALQAQINELHKENDELQASLDEYKAYEEEWTEEDERRDLAERSATAIIAEANEEANRIREAALADQKRIQRQMKTSAGGLTESITHLKEDLSGVEGDVSHVLEAVQAALSDILSSLGRTEQNLSTLDVQVERFPASAPAVPKQQVVYFQSSLPAAAQGGGGATKGFGTASFRKLGEDAGSVTAFRPSYTSQPEEDKEKDAEQDKKLRALSETLVDTLRQMMD